jgi:hypothetical protein
MREWKDGVESANRRIISVLIERDEARQQFKASQGELAALKDVLERLQQLANQALM